MPASDPSRAIQISKAQAKRLWIHAQRLDEPTPFGEGPEATRRAVEHLGYVQIDTINVIERCHHHILFSRIPSYQRQDLHRAQTVEKTVFEYWTHALSYVPTRDFRFFIPDMKRISASPGPWLKAVKKEEFQKVIRLIRRDGAISIRDIEDDVLVEKTHPWASRKPSKKALQFGFYTGRFVISERMGMVKKYELTDRHFSWEEKPKVATEKEILDYLLDRSLRSQALVSLDSICHLDAKKKPGIKMQVSRRVKKGELIPIHVTGLGKTQFWIDPKGLNLGLDVNDDMTHLLSPFDPLVIQRKRLKMLFDYEHKFEAYLPKEKRVFGYFALPVLIGDSVVAAIDLKTDREKRKLLVQKWSWIGKGKSAGNKRKIEEELGRFEKFQLES